ncbi:unnamed protein product [Linum trigynum]|uniref:Uncharacterized protein n=1 Tax=Linum trigynum TaxID=586398 RepID=A0AAV2E8N1_9ROSI
MAERVRSSGSELGGDNDGGDGRGAGESTAFRIECWSGFQQRWRSGCDLVGRSSEGITMAAMTVAPTAVAGGGDN